MQQQPHESLNPSCLPAAQQHREKVGVLVVDDDPQVQTLVRRILESTGFAVWSATSGHEALAIYQESREHLDMVLLDVRMPGLDGPGTLDALRELNPQVRACFMSGDLGNHDAASLLQRGAACVIAKPFRLEHLIHITQLVAQGMAPDQIPPEGGGCDGESEQNPEKLPVPGATGKGG